MKYVMTIIITCFIVCSCFSSNLVLVEFDTQSYDSTMKILKVMEEKGITPRHIFAPNYAIVDIHQLPITKIANNKYKLTTKDMIEHKQDIIQNKKIKKIYSGLISKDKNKVQIPNGNLHINEDLNEKSLTIESDKATMSTHITSRLTNQYMIGYIAVGIYLMESIGSQEDWYPEAEDTTFMEIVLGLDWLAEEANNQGAKVVWVYPPVEKIISLTEPIAGNHMPSGSEFGWLNYIYYSHGLSGGWDGAYGLANKLRHDYKTNWAVEITVVMNENDPNHQFIDGMMAYSVQFDDSGNSSARSPVIVVGYHNSNYPPTEGLRRIVIHEVSHAFGASDEYAGSSCDDANDCGVKNSFLGIVNGNCNKCSSYSEECYMKLPVNLLMCDYTLGHLGWYDDDGDGAMKPIDQNTGMYMYIQPVSAGDNVVIYYTAPH